MAAFLGVTIGSIKSYELGKAAPPLEVLVGYAKLMAVTLDDLVLRKASVNKRAVKSAAAQSIEQRLAHVEDILNVSRGVSQSPKTEKMTIPL